MECCVGLAGVVERWWEWEGVMWRWWVLGVIAFAIVLGHPFSGGGEWCEWWGVGEVWRVVVVDSV